MFLCHNFSLNIKNQSMSKFLTRQKAAEEMSISVRQLDRYIRSGRVKAFKPYNGKLVLIHFDSITEENLKSPVPVYRNFEDND